MRKKTTVTLTKIICLCITAAMLAGCTDIPGMDNGGAKSWQNETNESSETGTTGGGAIGKASKDGAGVKLSEEDRKAADEFASKVKINKTIGDFELTPMKQRSGIGDFLLRIKNINSFPASAFIECLYKDADGNVLYAVSDYTGVLASKAEDLISFSCGEDVEDFDTVEITAYVKGGQPNTVRMIDNYKPSKIKLSTGETEKGGMYDGWHKVEVKVTDPGGIIGDALTMFYDADGYLISNGSVWTGRDKKFNAYCSEPFDHCEILVPKLIDDVPALPDSIYEEYKAAGYLSEPGTVYTSPDGFVDYDFVTAEDGTILLHAVNKSDSRVDWYVNNTVIYSGSRDSVTSKLILEPGEDILWDAGFEAGTEFWLMDPVAYRAEEDTTLPPEVKFEDTGSERILTADIHDSVESMTAEYENIVAVSATVVYYKGENMVSAERAVFSDEMLCYRQEDDLTLKFDGDYDSCTVYIQYEPARYDEPGV
ncbi:MAG: hypothetical protein K6G22_13100 [Lachnospiraceae bacterium]|nr:hypothetical protein [Lachnospiraceae bacterium]